MKSGEVPEPRQFCFRFGEVDYDQARQQLRVRGTVVEIERRPLELLAELLRHPGEVLTKAELLESVWAGRPTVDNVLPSAIAKLRRAIGDEAGRVIVTVPRIGYRLDAAIERIAVGRQLSSGLALNAGDPVPGRTDYRLQQLLDRSDGSEVWLARHHRPGDVRVFKFAPDGERLPALKRELTLNRLLREALGARDDIVPLLDWNFEAPPFHLEYVYGGRTLLDWAQQDGQLAALDRAARLALFLQLVDAVAAAHSVGVLHKDLKPANILIAAAAGDRWQLRLSDFGGAGLYDGMFIEQLGITRLGMTVDSPADPSAGTPLYLAPELLAGQLPTVHSDVYALGILLYQLIVGDLRRTLAAGWEAGIDDPLLVEDIAAAANGDPALRPSSAAALADRVRHLDARRALQQEQEAIETRAVAAERRLLRVHARRPWLVTALATLVIALLLSLWLVRSADIEAQQLDAINRFLMNDLLAQGNPFIGGDARISLREAIDRAAGHIDTTLGSWPIASAEAHDRIALSYALMGQYEPAQRHYDRAMALYAQALGADHRRTLQVELDLVQMLCRTMKLDEAQRRVDHARHVGPMRDPAFAKKVWQRQWLIHSNRGQHLDALRDYEQIAALTGTAVEAPFTTYAALGRWDEAERLGRRDIQVSTAELGGDHLSVLAQRNEFNSMLIGHRPATELIADAQALHSAIVARAGEDSPLARDARANLGLLQAELGDVEAARDNLSAALQAARRAGAPLSSDVVVEARLRQLTSP